MAIDSTISGHRSPDPVPFVGAKRRLRSRRGQGDLLREEILAAAEQLLIRTDDQATVSVRAIAAAVGVTAPSIYLHFTDRNELIFAVCERHAVQLETAMAKAAEGIGDPLERLRHRGRAYLDYGLSHPEHYRILMMSRPDATPDRFVDERLVDTAGLTPVADDLRCAIEEGLIRPQDPLLGAELCWMVIHGAVSLLISKPDFPWPPVDEIYDQLYDTMRAGLRAP
jgi:AcrR family transcriptional regulator